MPKRQTTYRVDSTEVQGEGSWVELLYLTHGEAQASIKGELEDKALLKKHVVAWNWVDSEGEPFGEPRDHLFDLFIQERWFLLDKLFNPMEVDILKNSKAG